MNTKVKTDWLAHIEGWLASGKSKREYCAEHSINTHTFDYHRHKHKAVQTKNHFIELDAVQEKPVHGCQPARQEKIELHFSDGRVVLFPLNTPLKTLRTILAT